MSNKKNHASSEQKVRRKKRKPYLKPEMISEELFEANVLACGKVPSQCLGYEPVKHT